MNIDNKYDTMFYRDLFRKNKWLGIVDYKTLMFILIYCIAIINIINIFNIRFEYKLYLDMFFIIPVIVITFCSVDDENILEVVKTVIKFNLSTKIYIYDMSIIDQFDRIICYCKR